MNLSALPVEQSPDSNLTVLGVALVFVIVLLICIAVLFQFAALYIQARVSGAPVTLNELMGMHLRKVNAKTIVYARIQALRTGLDISIPQMESHVLAGGELQNVVNAMIAANRGNLDLSWKTATAMDLMGRDVLKEVQKQILPPDPLHARPPSP